MKSSRDATDPSQYIPQEIHNSCGLLHYSCSHNDFLSLTCIPCFPSGIPMFLLPPGGKHKDSTKTALDWKEKLVFLEWTKFVNVVFTTSPAYSWDLKEAVRNWTGSRSFQWHQLFFLKHPLLFLSHAPTAALGRMLCTDKVFEITQNECSYLNTCFPLI